MRWIFHFRVFIIVTLSVILISTAVIFSVLRAVLPYATGYKNEIQQEISQQIGLPVEINSIDAAIHWFSPRLKLIDVSIYDNKYKVPLFNFKEAFVELDVVASILRGEIIVADVGVIGADISIEKLSDIEWQIQGVRFTSEGSSELPDQFLYMIQNSDYLLHDSNIYYQDHTGEKLNLSLFNVNIDVNNNFNNHEIKFSMNLPEEYGENISVVASLSDDIDSLDGDIYIEAHKLKINQWNSKFNLLKTHQIDAVVDINLWTTLEDNIVQSLFVELNSSAVKMKNNETGKRWQTDYLATNLRYTQNEEQWNIALSDFYFGRVSQPDWGVPVNILAGTDEDQFYFSVDFLRVSDLQDIAAVILDKDALAELEKIKQYKLQADIFNINARLAKEATKDNALDGLELEASVSNLSASLADREMYFSGVDAAIQYGDNTATIDVLTENAEFELKKLFREKIVAETIQGKISLQIEEDNWQLASNRLQLRNKHVNTFSRLDIRALPDKKIFVDVETDFYDGHGKYATRYLPVGIMKPKLVDWLDMAITSGYVPEGKFVLYGNLSDFPYREHQGVFQVLFRAQNVDMLFLKNWPMLEQASAKIKFINSSLNLSNAKAETQKASLYNGYAQIADLFNPELTVNTDAHAKNQDVQSYIWNSPLDAFLGKAMRLFQFEGESELNLKIDLPLNNKEVEVGIDGRLNFIDTEIYYDALGYELKNINGIVEFTRDTIYADSLKAMIQDQPVIISALTREGKAGRENIFNLEGGIAADYLLQRYDWIPEPWLDGQSEWAMSIEVPHHPEDYIVHINADSSLQGVALKISDKVQKPAGDKINFQTEVFVLDKNSLRVELKAVDTKTVGGKTLEVFDLYAVRNQGHVWNFDVNSTYITGKGEFTEGLDKDTTIKLDLDKVDVHSLFVSKSSSGSKPLDPVKFPPLKWKAKKVLWDEWKFTDVVVETSWHEHGMLINKLSLLGPAMTFDARGTWLTSWRDLHETVLQGTITSTNLGDTLTGLGFQRSIDRSQYKATFSSRWPAEPYGLSWANMKGDTSFEMENGEILEVDPGAGGRLLGLMNIFKLTNRLAFDFDDVTREGFAFDSIKGDFEFVNGAGSLKNFDVLAPAADINMFGSIGLVDRDYGLLMRVKPHTDTLTLAGGTLLGGFAVGAGLALIQKVFDIGIIGHNVYSITGSWDDPQVEKIIQRTQSTAEDDDF